VRQNLVTFLEKGHFSSPQNKVDRALTQFSELVGQLSLREHIMSTVMAAYWQPFYLACVVVNAAGPNMGITAAELARDLELVAGQKRDDQIAAAVELFWNKIDQRSKYQVHLNDVADYHYEKRGRLVTTAGQQ
jgi:hypothetical protein